MVFICWLLLGFCYVLLCIPAWYICYIPAALVSQVDVALTLYMRKKWSLALVYGVMLHERGRVKCTCFTLLLNRFIEVLAVDQFV